MPGFFPKMYKGELLYGILARYHKYSVNRGYRDTLNDIFGCTNVVPSIEFPSHLRYLTETLSLDKNYFIMNHSLYPYYAPFMDSETKRRLTNMMYDGDGKGIKALIGFVAGSVCKKDSLYFCPECSQKNIGKQEEPYIHSLHQAQGVKVCTMHNCYLEKYPVSQLDVSRLEYICFEHDIIESYSPIRSNISDDSTLIKVACSAKYLLENDLSFLNINKVKEVYRRRLNDLGFLTPNGTVRQNALSNEIIRYYGNRVLEELESNFVIENDYNWVKVITREDTRKVHPLRHILLINYLFPDMRNFFEASKESVKPKFYPCLNPVAEHFKEHIIKKVIVTPDYKTREPVGTFQCEECGFIYSRKLTKDNLYKVGRIKEFGHIWECELAKQVVVSNSLRGIASKMGCDPKTVVKFARKLGLEQNLNSNMKLTVTESKSEQVIENPGPIYIQDIKNYIKDNPFCTRTQVRLNFPKQYIYLYRNDREALFNLLPEKSLPSNGKSSKSTYDVWIDKDKEYLQQINDVVKKLEAEGIKRVSRTLLIRKTGKGATLEKNLFRLPLCTDKLEQICKRYS